MARAEARTRGVDESVASGPSLGRCGTQLSNAVTCRQQKLCDVAQSETHTVVTNRGDPAQTLSRVLSLAWSVIHLHGRHSPLSLIHNTATAVTGTVRSVSLPVWPSGPSLWCRLRLLSAARFVCSQLQAAAIEAADKADTMGLILLVMPDDILMTVGLDGVLPRKTFYLGEADDKRYFEAKGILACELFFVFYLFWFLFFLAARHPAGIDMCPAAGALTLAMVPSAQKY